MKVINGDLIEAFKNGHFDAIIHGCNCFHTMGAGIAGQIVQVWPQVLEIDKLTKRGQWRKLSNWSSVYLPNNQIIINLYTQYLPGKALSENALFLGFEKLTRYYIHKELRVGIPAIGCGIAGGNWDNIYPVLSEITKGYDFTYMKYEPSTDWTHWDRRTGIIS